MTTSLEQEWQPGKSKVDNQKRQNPLRIDLQKVVVKGLSRLVIKNTEREWGCARSAWKGKENRLENDNDTALLILLYSTIVQSIVITVAMHPNLLL